jgi:hypothetical protein
VIQYIKVSQMECLVPLPTTNFSILKLQGLWIKTLSDNLVAHTHSHIHCNLRTFHIHNIYDELCDKHIKIFMCHMLK